jgi:hypothetical protein
MASCTFLSAEWCEGASAAARDARLPSDAHCRLEFQLADVVCSLVVADGRVAFRPGPIGDPDATLTSSVEVAWEIVTCARSREAALEAMTVSVVLPSGETYVGTPAPMGMFGRPELDAMRALPDATLVVQHSFAKGPFGDIDYVVRFVDGQIVDEHLGRAREPADVILALSYRRLALLRSGLCTVLEALEDGGRVEGNVSSLMAVAALYERIADVAPMRATGAQTMALATLGELHADEAFQNGMRALMRETTPVTAG